MIGFIIIIILRQNAATLARFIGIFKIFSTSTVYRKEGSNEIVMMESSKVNKTIVSVVTVYTYRTSDTNKQ